MNNQQILSTIFILGLALASITHMPGKPGNPPTSTSPAGSSVSGSSSDSSTDHFKSNPSASDFLVPLQDFLRTESSESLGERQEIYAKLTSLAQIHVLIATVPDPIDSSFA